MHFSLKDFATAIFYCADSPLSFIILLLMFSVILRMYGFLRCSRKSIVSEISFKASLGGITLLLFGGCTEL